MATKFHTFKGKLMWTQNITQVDDFRGTKNYKANIILDEASLKEFEESGIQTKPREDKEGNLIHTFKRPERKLIKGDLVEFGPPEYVDENGDKIEGVIVANDSEAELEVVSYDTVMGKGHRLNKVTVTKLIPYEPDPETEVARTGQENTRSAQEAAIFE